MQVRPVQVWNGGRRSDARLIQRYSSSPPARRRSFFVVRTLLLLLFAHDSLADASFGQTEGTSSVIETIFLTQLSDPFGTLQNVACTATSQSDLERLVERHVATPIAQSEQQKPVKPTKLPNQDKAAPVEQSCSCPWRQFLTTVSTMIRDGQEYILKIRNHNLTVREYQQRVGFVQTDPNRFAPELHIPGSRNRQPAPGTDNLQPAICTLLRAMFLDPEFEARPSVAENTTA